MIFSTDSNVKPDVLSIGILALYILHSEMQGESPMIFGMKPRKPKQLDPQGDHEQVPQPRPLSRASLVVSPWCVVDDVVSIATSATPDCVSEAGSILVEEVEGVDLDSLASKSPVPREMTPDPPSIWGRFLTPVFGG